MDRIKGEVLNLGTDLSHDIVSIAHMITEKMGRSASLITHIGDRPGQVFRHTASTEKTARLIGWRPVTRFSDRLDKTIAWYRDNRPWWEKQLWMRSIPIITKQGKRELH